MISVARKFRYSCKLLDLWLKYHSVNACKLQVSAWTQSAQNFFFYILSSYGSSNNCLPYVFIQDIVIAKSKKLKKILNFKEILLWNLKKLAKIVESLKFDRLYPNYSSRPKFVGKMRLYTVFWASFDPLLLVYVLCTQPLWRYEGLQLSICTNHTAGNTLNLQHERDIQIFYTQSGSQATCKLLDTCKHYLYKPDTCKPLTTTTLAMRASKVRSLSHEPRRFSHVSFRP